jgi:uncharacterized membrane protein
VSDPSTDEPATAAPVATADSEETENQTAAPPATTVTRSRDRVVRFFRSPDGIPFGVLALLALAFTIKYSSLVIMRQNRYGSFDFDTGIYDQAAWLSAHGMQFDTVRGLPLYGHHATFGFWFFAPAYWLDLNGPTVMDVAQVLALASVALVAYWVARRLHLEPWIAAVVGFVCLAHFSVSWLAQELFHPEVFAIAPLLAAYGFALRDQRKAYAAMLVLAVIWKEDVALAIVGLGALLWLQKRRRLGVYTMLFGIVWFVVATQVLLPHFSPTGKAFYADGFYGDLGNNVPEIATSLVAHPHRILAHLQHANGFGYVRDLFTPFAFVNLLAPATLLIALPQLLANLLSVNSFTWSLRFHYVALPLTASILGFVLGLKRLRGQWRHFAAGLAVAATIATALAWGVGPYSKNYQAGYWPLTPPTNQAQLDHAVSLIPPTAAVSASYHLVPHLSSRELIFSFPNPFKPRNWGIGDRDQRNPSIVQWLVVNRTDLSSDDEQLLDKILHERKGFRIVYQRGGVLVARRTRPG